MHSLRLGALQEYRSLMRERFNAPRVVWVGSDARQRRDYARQATVRAFLMA